jgi:hypothetical protein
MSKWQCNNCGVTANLDITISLGIQDCKCGGYLVEVKQ